MWQSLALLGPKNTAGKTSERLALPRLEYCTTPEQYIEKHATCRAAIMDAQPDHYLASAESAVADLLSGLSDSFDAKLIKAKFDIADDDTVVSEATVAALTAKILELKTRRKLSGARNQSNRKSNRFRSPPGDPNVKDYACMTHLVDNHKECKGRLTKFGAPPSKRSDYKQSRSTSASASNTELVPIAFPYPIAASTEMGDVNDNDNYLFRPALDSVSSDHFLREKKSFVSLNPSQKSIELGNGTKIRSQSTGDATLCTSTSKFALKGTLLAPEMKRDLISASRLVADNDILLRKDKLYVLPQSDRPPPSSIAIGITRNGVYEF